MPVHKNAKWEIACQALVLEDLTQVDAFLRAFPQNAHKGRQTLATRAHEMFNRKGVPERIAELMVDKETVAKEKFAVDAAYVLGRIVDIDRMGVLDIMDDPGTLKPVKEWPPIWRQFISQFEVEEIFAGRGDKRLSVGLLKKIKWPDKIRNLELMGKHVSVSAFKEILEHQGKGGGPLRMITTEMTPQEAAEAYADTLRSA